MFKRTFVFALLPAICWDLESDQNFLKALLEKGHYQMAQNYRNDHPLEGLDPFLEQLLDIQFLKAQIELGETSLQKELNQLYDKVDQKITAKNLDADRLTLKFEIGKSWIDQKKIKKGIENLEFFSRHCPRVLSSMPVNEDKRKLSNKFYDNDLYLGEAYFKLMKLENDKEEKIDLADKSLEKLEDYIWSLSKNPAIAVKGYLPLIEVTKFLAQEDLADLDDLIDQFTATTFEEGGDMWRPIWKIEANPSSIVNIFDIAKKIISLEVDTNKRSRLAKEFSKQLNKISLDPTPNLYMKDHHNLMMSYFYSFLSQEANLSNKNASTYKKLSGEFIQKIAFDPTKSPYATQAAQQAQLLGLDVEVSALGGQDLLFQKPLNLYKQGKYETGRKVFIKLLPTTGFLSPQRAHLWFRIGQGYYKQQQYLEAYLAFEKSWQTNKAWSQGNINAQKVYEIMNNAAKLYYSQHRKKHQNRDLTTQIADNNFIQTVRKDVFTNFPESAIGVAAKYQWASSMYRSNYIENNFSKAYRVFSMIPKSSRKYGQSLYYKFQCSFKEYQNNQETEARKKLFEQASLDAENLFSFTKTLDPKKEENKSILELDANARSTIIQLYLLQEGYAAKAKELIEILESKFSPWLDEDIKKQIPNWKITSRIKIGDTKSLKEAMEIWQAWQKSQLLKNKEPSNLLIRSTQSLANKGIKQWMSKNQKSSQLQAFKIYNSNISKWIKNNIKVTPLLLVQLALDERNNKQWLSVIENAEQFIDLYQNDSSWKTNQEAKKYINNMYTYQAEAYSNLQTEEGHAQAARCWEDFYKRLPNSLYLRKQADSLKAAGDNANDKSQAKEHYGRATQIYSRLRKISKNYKTGTKLYWESYNLTLECRSRMGQYENCLKILQSLRFNVIDSKKQRQWLINWLDQIEKNLDAQNQDKVKTLREDLEKDRLEYLENIKTSETPSNF